MGLSTSACPDAICATNYLAFKHVFASNYLRQEAVRSPQVNADALLRAVSIIPDFAEYSRTVFEGASSRLFPEWCVSVTRTREAQLAFRAIDILGFTRWSRSRTPERP